MNIGVYVAHYKGNKDRLKYLTDSFKNTEISTTFITEFDSGEFNIDENYTYDELLFRSIIDRIKNIMVGYVLGLDNLKDTPWPNCVSIVKDNDFSLAKIEETCPWLRPKKLSSEEISIYLKHRDAWRRIAEGSDEWAIIAEDDIIFNENSIEYLKNIANNLPSDFDYVDIAGGCGLFPRIGNRVVNKFFFDMEPPRDRTLCGALISKSFAKKLVELNTPVCVPVDWYLTYAFNMFSSKVYWLSPPVFGHGSEMKVYASSIR